MFQNKVYPVLFLMNIKIGQTMNLPVAGVIYIQKMRIAKVPEPDYLCQRDDDAFRWNHNQDRNTFRLRK